MEININYDLNTYTAVIVHKTLLWAGVEKTDEELKEFCMNFTKDKDVQEALKNMIKIQE